MEKTTKDINIATEELKQNLIKIIGDCGLPIANIYLVFKLILNEIEPMYFSVVNAKDMEEKENKSEI